MWCSSGTSRTRISVTWHWRHACERQTKTSRSSTCGCTERGSRSGRSRPPSTTFATAPRARRSWCRRRTRTSRCFWTTCVSSRAPSPSSAAASTRRSPASASSSPTSARCARKQCSARARRCRGTGRRRRRTAQASSTASSSRSCPASLHSPASSPPRLGRNTACRWSSTGWRRSKLPLSNAAPSTSTCDESGDSCEMMSTSRQMCDDDDGVYTGVMNCLSTWDE
mmetsp:Transcript_34425/g.71019  ORF Transcript_34425/g.71019 Transcript_34425/m.71019 type:complete len:225 (+) Transcript_34425:150-824(+)